MQLIAHWVYISGLSGVLTPRKWCMIVTELPTTIEPEVAGTEEGGC